MSSTGLKAAVARLKITPAEDALAGGIPPIGCGSRVPADTSEVRLPDGVRAVRRRRVEP